MLLFSMDQYVVSTPCNAQSSRSAVKHGQSAVQKSGNGSSAKVDGSSSIDEGAGACDAIGASREKEKGGLGMKSLSGYGFSLRVEPVD